MKSRVIWSLFCLISHTYQRKVSRCFALNQDSPTILKKTQRNWRATLKKDRRVLITSMRKWHSRYHQVILLLNLEITKQHQDSWEHLSTKKKQTMSELFNQVIKYNLNQGDAALIPLIFNLASFIFSSVVYKLFSIWCYFDLTSGLFEAKEKGSLEYSPSN